MRPSEIMAGLRELAERQRRLDAMIDQSIAAAARVVAETDKILAEIRSGVVFGMPDRRDDDQKDYDEERTGEAR
jgi:hypothetical protein